ncbi:hypothetical protein LMH87_003989 [Akanthomyces muscarius]|uniref:Uncharacterized protein n=1 Tax=Akanthomyces muscarius TaxID=2231603 RepID=A0A9W8Q2W8_AKAMU|nr:hypothetical protein LMH87_003989 [Akanthomyces muscarius]KAJ4145130.1 hypothetical protein LMH87_003989 [Akanthomyces muscarius]
MAQAPPAYINIPQPGSNPDTPSEMPGTPTSTTTSLSALSTTAIKDGHRGHLPGGPLGRGHQHTPSTTSLEAERADRISRLAGLERVSTLRAPPSQHIPISGAGGGVAGGGDSSLSPQTTPTSTTGFPANFPASQNLTASYFDANGQPVAVTKMSTVGTASATESSRHGEEGMSGSRQTAGDRDEDMFSNADTNYRETADSVASMAAEPEDMDEDMEDEGAATRSVGGYEDRMSDDGSASLVGFGEGANSTVSGPIYHRRPAPGPSAQAQQQAPWSVERTVSGLSDIRRDRDLSLTPGAGSDVPASAAALQERREARMIDGVAADAGYPGPEYEPYVDTTFRGPVPVNLTGSRQQQQQPREVAEQIVQRLSGSDARSGVPSLSQPGQGGEPLGQFSFEVDRDGRRD